MPKTDTLTLINMATPMKPMNTCHWSKVCNTTLQYYIALERRGVPVEMYLYPRQGHAITEPHLLADAIQSNLDWFTTKLLSPGA